MDIYGYHGDEVFRKLPRWQRRVMEDLDGYQGDETEDYQCDDGFW